MNARYLRGIAGQYFYNSTEALAYLLTHRPVPDNIAFNKKIYYGKEKQQYYHTFCKKDSSDKKKPLFIYIHGGGWISGITDMRNTYLYNWAEKGFFVCSVSYTYAPQKVFPSQLQEVYSAIDMILDKAEDYNIDADNIILAGESAGGYYISFVASCVQNREVLRHFGISFRHIDSFRIKALVSHCGCYDLNRMTDKNKKQSGFPDIKMMISSFLGKSLDEVRELLASEEGYLYSPRITPEFPPIFFTWGDKDLLRYEAFDLSKELRENDVDFELFKSDGIIGMHAWSIVLLFKKSRICFDKSFDFVLRYI